MFTTNIRQAGWLAGWQTQTHMNAKQTLLFVQTPVVLCGSVYFYLFFFLFLFLYNGNLHASKYLQLKVDKCIQEQQLHKAPVKNYTETIYFLLNATRKNIHVAECVCLCVYVSARVRLKMKSQARHTFLIDVVDVAAVAIVAVSLLQTQLECLRYFFLFFTTSAFT